MTKPALDIEHLAEEIEDLWSMDRHNLDMLLLGLLEFAYGHCRHDMGMYYWQSAVVDYHWGMLADSLEESPPLRPFLRERVPHTYYWGAKTTAAVTSSGYSHAAAPPASGASQAGFPLALPPTQPTRFLTRDGQPRGRRLGLPPQAPAAIIAVDPVPGAPPGGDPGREGACQLRLGGHGAVRRDPRLLAARGRRSQAGRYAAPPGTPDASSSTTPGPEAQARLP